MGGRVEMNVPIFLYSLLLSKFFFLTIDLLIGWKFQNIIDGIPWYPLFEISRLLTTLPAFAVGVRRLHDLNKSGWWILLIFTGIGIIPIVYWCCFLNSDKDDNQYGLSPTQ